MAAHTALTLFLLIFLHVQYSLSSGIPVHAVRKPAVAALQAHGIHIPPRVINATQAQIDQAYAIVKASIAQAAKLNEARVKNPARNTYKLAPGTIIKRDSNDTQTGIRQPPLLLNITTEIANAAALIAEIQALNTANASRTVLTKRSSFWMENISRKGTVPWGNIDGFQVFRNVKDFGAVGDGVHDDTEAIKTAIMAASSGNRKSARCGAGCYGSSTQNAIIYFPQGTYLVSSTIDVVFGTQLIGDATNWPTIKAAPSFVGMGVLATDEYVPNGGNGADGNAKEWYINTASFYRQIRNFKIDIRASSQDAYICAIHYQVAQATSLQYVELISTSPSDNPATTQQGIFAENGSGGQMSDLTFTGGNFGLYGGSQQFTAQRLTFKGCKTGVQLIWDWGWTWKSIEMDGVGTGFRLISEDGTGNIGSVYVMDTKFTNVATAILTKPASKDPGTGTTGITLDNVAFSNVQHYVFDTNGKEYVEGAPSSVDTWTLGPVYFRGTTRDVSLGYSFTTPRKSPLVGTSNGLPKSPFFERAKPQYEDLDASAFVHVKDHGCKGDGSTDDTAAFQAVLDAYGNSGSVIFVDAGTYILTDTVTVPPGTRIVGEAWSQLAASGSKFSSIKYPHVMFRVGDKGSVGSVEIQDLLFTTKGATPGAILIEWNLLADKQGSAGMWDCHTRLGGATGTELTPSECPPSTTGTDSGCSAGSLMMHITSTGTAYLENVWLWVADHMTDDPDWTDDGNDMVQNSIYNARGFLIESTAATWLYGTASEHSVYYQYNINNAKYLFAGMIQTESPYYQPAPTPPAPFADAVGVFRGDPSFSCQAGEAGCDESWAVMIQNSEDVFIAGAGLYSWFSTYSQACVDSSNCQKKLVYMDTNKDVIIHNLITIGATNMITSDGSTIPSKDNLAVKSHPYWSQLTVFYPIQNTPDPCKASNGISTWHGNMPEGEFFPGPDGAGWPGTKDEALITYVTLVNGCPHDFTLTSKHSYQMPTFDFDTVPSGASSQNKQEYQQDGAKIFVDDKGEAYYSITDTDDTFQLQARTNSESDHRMREVYYFDNFATDDVAKNSSFELMDRGGHRAFNLIITGSERYGHYWTSVNPPVAWMHAILDVIGERKLRHVSMIGSHDAGISKRNGGTAFADADNSQTQKLNISGQLGAGSRFFDIRPVVGNGGQYLAGHYNLPSSVPQGINGEYLTDIVDEINGFTATNGELIILHISHAYNTDEGYRDMNNDEFNKVFDIMQGLTHRCGGLDGDLTDKTINDFIGDGNACVLIISDGGTARPAEGIYNTGSSFGWDGEGHWSNTDSISDMASDQLSYLASHRNIIQDDGKRLDKFMVMQWILTLEGLENAPGTGPDDHSISIESFATRMPYDALFWKAWNAFTPWSYPNVVLLDYVGDLQQLYDDQPVGKELITLAMAMNLAIASKNCYVGGGTIY
ncbi:glucan 1,3-beta-glucosidase [Aspergillus lentulus]|uniref:Glucan 1,3-beta-glucosidase n=1 Tax=Aspergillus lentulus TaxID=293939 RepID=A0ABQ1A494_ASPLE|nr:glucan 1,3-beta-glucosidase [Aspergillus lentulus]